MLDLKIIIITKKAKGIALLVVKKEDLMADQDKRTDICGV